MQQVVCISHQFLQRRQKKNVLIYIFAGRKHTISEELMASLDGERKEGEWRGVE